MQAKKAATERRENKSALTDAAAPAAGDEGDEAAADGGDADGTTAIDQPTHWSQLDVQTMKVCL